MLSHKTSKNSFKKNTWCRRNSSSEATTLDVSGLKLEETSHSIDIDSEHVVDSDSNVVRL